MKLKTLLVKHRPMKNIGAMIVMLVIGFIIGTFTNLGNDIFSFLEIGPLSNNVESTTNQQNQPSIKK